MKIALVLIAVVMLPSVAFAASKADMRAVEACKAGSSTFVEISACLPEAHVAVRVLDKFRDIYPPAAQPLAEKCTELNAKDIAGAYTCVNEAIDVAVKLKASLPDGVTLDDPVFDAVADAKMKATLDAVRDAARKEFPDQPYWGGRTYHAYK